MIEPTVYIIGLQKDLDFETLNSFDKEFIDKHMITDMFEKEKYGVEGRIVIIVPIDRAYYLTKASRENVKKLMVG